MCILLICVFKLPKLLKTQLHSVQLYVGPFFTFKKKSKFSLHIPNIMFFNIFPYNKYTMGLWELKWFIFSSYQYAVMESGWHLLDKMNYNLCAWLQLLTTTSQHCEQQNKYPAANEASDFSLFTISYHSMLKSKTEMQLYQLRHAWRWNIYNTNGSLEV